MGMAGAGFTIGGLSPCAGVNIETIGYYERVGLMPDLRRPKTSTAEISAHSDGGTVPECPVIDTPFAGAERGPEFR